MQFIRYTRYSTAFVCSLILAVTAMLCISMVNALLLKQSILDERKETIRAAVNTAHDTLATSVEEQMRSSLDISRSLQSAAAHCGDVAQNVTNAAGAASNERYETAFRLSE